MTPLRGQRLVGREEELARFDRLLRAAVEGASGVLSVHGEPGIGKSALLAAAFDAAPSALRLAAVRCHRVDADLGFAAVRDLLRPLGDVAGALAPSQRDLLTTAFAPDPVPGSAAPSVAAIALTVLELLAAAAPVAVVVDDVQWADSGTLQVLGFLARHLGHEGVALVTADRGRHPDAGHVHDGGCLHLHGLTPEQAAALLRADGRDARPGEIERLVHVTAGNPLALLELVGRVDPTAWSTGAPPLVPELLADAYVDELRPLPPDVRALLVTAAASFTGRAGEVLAAVGLAPDAGRRALEAAEAAGIVALDGGRVAFRHPLLRAAAYQQAGAAARRTAHTALAVALAPDPAAADERAWHLAAAVVGVDAAVAQALCSTAGRAVRRGALDAGYAAYWRAQELAGEPTQRAACALAAARWAQRAGRLDAAIAALDVVEASSTDPQVLTAAALVRSQLDVTRMPAPEALAHLVAAAAPLRHTDPPAAAALLTTAAAAGCMGGLTAEASDAASTAAELVRGAPPLVRLGPTVLPAYVGVLRAETQGVDAAVDRCVQWVHDAAVADAAVEVLGFLGLTLLWLDRHGDLRAVVGAAVDRAAAAGAIDLLPTLTSVLAEQHLRRGEWARASAAATQCVALADTLQQPLLAGYALTTLARLEAARGDPECERTAARARELLETAGYALVAPYADLALAELDLTLGRPAAAARFDDLARRVAGFGVRNPVVIPYLAGLVEAHVRAGQPEAAAAALAQAEAAVPDQARSPSVRAALLRCRGLLASYDAEALDDLREAYDRYADLGFDYERARTGLLWGERLRRTRQRGHAGVVLAESAAAFARLGATPWAERARTELRLTGVAAAEPVPRQRSRATLTGQEASVAQLISTGATNREAAARLFLSVKTVEYHLSNVYAKLGVRSRTELARLLGEVS